MADCLDSVGQSFGDFEVIVVNGSSPDTPELEKVLQPYLDSIVYIKQVNRHAAGAINTAIGRARGECLAFLDSEIGYELAVSSLVQPGPCRDGGEIGGRELLLKP